MRKTGYVLFISLLSLLLIGCAPRKAVRVTITNPLPFDRSEELAEIDLSTLQKLLPLADGQTYRVLDDTKTAVTSQATYDGLLVFPSGTKEAESKKYQIIAASDTKAYPTKTYGRYISERKDDFAWENDRVAFRVYGPALLPIDGPSNGIDIWYKRTNELIIDKWYEKDLAGKGSYHNDNGEGLDDYKVGQTLGAGAMAPYIDDSLVLNSNYVTQQLLENGPLRTTFELTYAPLDINGKQVHEKRIFSIDAGTQLTKVIQAYTVDKPMEVAAGIVLRAGQDGYQHNQEKNYIVYHEYSQKAGNVFVSILFPEGMDRSVTNTYDYIHPTSKRKTNYKHVLGVSTYTPNQPITYYTGFGWDKFGYQTIADFELYMNNFSEALKNPLKIKIK